MDIEKSIVEPYQQSITPLPTGLTPKGQPTAPIHCLLCDIYGTLFISGSGDIGIARKQKPVHGALDTLLAKYHQSMGATELLRQLYQTIEHHHGQARQGGVVHPEVQIDEIWSEILTLKDYSLLRRFCVEFEMIMNPVWPMPGLKTLLHRCRDNGIFLGIVSNAQFFTAKLFEWFLDAGLCTLGFLPQLTIMSYEHGQAKPSQELFAMAAKNLEGLEVAPQNVAYLGNDMRNDIVPAHSAGFQTILFAGDARSLRLRKNDPQCQAIAPDMIITELGQLVPYLKCRLKKN